MHNALSMAGASVMRLIVAMLCAAACLSGGCAESDGASSKRVVRVAAAADLKFALDEVIGAFSKEHDAIDVQASYGSSGNFFAQLSNQAPYDLYFSADIDYPQRLIDAGHAQAGSLFEYARGRIVVWVRGDSPIDVETLGMDALLHERVRKIAIANPHHAPYGRAAVEALQSLNMHDRIAEKFVLGENVAQTAQFVESGAAEIGIIALSLALAPTMEGGRYWLIPEKHHLPLVQGGVVMKWAADAEATSGFRDYVTGQKGRAILRRYGFILPGE